MARRRGSGEGPTRESRRTTTTHRGGTRTARGRGRRSKPPVGERAQRRCCAPPVLTSTRRSGGGGCRRRIGRARDTRGPGGGAVECRLRRLCNRGTGVARGAEDADDRAGRRCERGTCRRRREHRRDRRERRRGRRSCGRARDAQCESARHVALPRTTTSTSGSTQRRRVDCASQKTRPRAAPRAFTTRSSPGSVPPLSRARHPCVGVEGRMRLASRS